MMSTGGGGIDVPAVSARPSVEVAAGVQTVCRQLYASESEFLDRFRTSLLQLVPRLRVSTPDQGAAVAESLARAVLWAALTDDPPEVVEATFQNIGADHARRGFPADGYHGAGHALLRSARDTYSGDWSSELSSGWVAYYSWLGAHLETGVRRSGLPREPGHLAPGGAPALRRIVSMPAQEQGTALAMSGHAGLATATRPAPTRADLGAPESLDDVLALLRARYFPGNERALGAIVTRIALRTGADLRAPRADQRANPAVIANVLAVLQVMGYAMLSAPGGLQVQVQVVGEPAPRRQAHWWNRGRGAQPDAEPHGWRRAIPGLFR
jgi:hemoglobin-like flavoprotein